MKRLVKHKTLMLLPTTRSTTPMSYAPAERYVTVTVVTVTVDVAVAAAVVCNGGEMCCC